MPYEKYLKLREEGKLTIEAMKTHCVDVNAGNTFTIALISLLVVLLLSELVIFTDPITPV